MSGLHIGMVVFGLNPLNPTDSLGKTPWLLGKDVFLIVGISLLLAAGLFVWVTRAMGRSRRHHRHHTVPGILQKKSVDSADEEVTEQHDHHRRRRRRRRRRLDHAERNPTLAETGGLPPARSMDSPSPGRPASSA